MKTIIIYYSHTHNNEILAQDLQRKLSCDILRIEEAGRRTAFTILLDIIFNRSPKLAAHGASLESYDNFVFVAPIWAGKIASPLKSFLLKEKDHVKSYSFISLCGGAKGQLDKIRTELTTILRYAPKIIKELWINDLLPPEQRNTVKYTSSYRLLPADLSKFSEEIDEFVRQQDSQHNLSYHELR